jgi:hypothetical protein
MLWPSPSRWMSELRGQSGLALPSSLGRLRAKSGVHANCNSVRYCSIRVPGWMHPVGSYGAFRADGTIHLIQLVPASESAGSACRGGQGAEPYEQKTQQSPKVGRSTVPQPVHL